MNKEAIKAVALTSQRGTLINVDKEGKPLRPAIIWLDQSVAHHLPPMGVFWETLFTLVRQKQTIDYFRSQAEANWIGVVPSDPAMGSTPKTSPGKFHCKPYNFFWLTKKDPTVIYTRIK